MPSDTLSSDHLIISSQHIIHLITQSSSSSTRRFRREQKLADKRATLDGLMRLQSARESGELTDRAFERRIELAEVCAVVGGGGGFGRGRGRGRDLVIYFLVFFSVFEPWCVFQLCCACFSQWLAWCLYCCTVLIRATTSFSHSLPHTLHIYVSLWFCSHFLCV